MLMAAGLLFASLWSPSLAQGELFRFRLLPKESQIETRVSGPFGGTVAGRFMLQEGEAQGDINDLKGTGWVRLNIDAASYDSNLALRDQDVQENYLEVKTYPAISFVSTGMEEVKKRIPFDAAWDLTIKGVLQLHGVKREIRVPVTLSFQGRKIVAEGSTRISLKEFNIAVPTLLFFIRAGDQVEVAFRLVGEHQP